MQFHSLLVYCSRLKPVGYAYDSVSILFARQFEVIFTWLLDSLDVLQLNLKSHVVIQALWNFHSF